ncbi:MAG: methyltransferase domain-containing protein [Solirubrobacterales bacterium]
MNGGSEIKDRQRAMWTAGDYPAIAQRIEPASATVVASVGVGEGDGVLDVATGTGNAALVAAALGAEVTGLDLTPKLIEVARRRAQEAELRVEFLEGDAENLPFDDDSFDRVVSVFGVMFAPDQQRAADELARVCRPGGRIGVCAWTPDGVNGRMFAVIGSHMPPPPEGFMPPVLWGTEERLRQLFAGSGAELSFERRFSTFEDESAETWVDYNSEALGPVILAKQALGDGWGAARDDLVGLYEDANESEDGGLSFRAEYLETVVTLPST